jgi:2-succinyl-5-enolpyruvyl-6-hydroxy-3-cyclohexene-1-carboxylate synthase
VDRNELGVTAAATFAATLVDEWCRAGVEHAVVAPGSRSTPIAVALAAAAPRLRVHVHQDERAAAFTALGIAVATAAPVVVVTTSGTAAAEVHPAVVEADLGRAPLLVCTADRPPELHHVGAPQTVDQTHLYGSAVRRFFDAGVPDDAGAGAWRSLASRAVCEALGPPPGPVHLNLAFRDPLVGSAGPLPEGRAAGAPWHEHVHAPRRIAHDDAVRLAGACRHRDGVIVAGGGVRHPEHVLLLAHTLGWPVLADPRSGCRLPDRAVIAHFDALLRSDAVARPEVVVRLGSPPTSKALSGWIRSSDCVEIAIDRDGWWYDPDRTAAFVVEADPATACLELAPLVDDSRSSDGWLESWTLADMTAREAIAQTLAPMSTLTEPAVARAVVAALPDDASLVVSSSMPVRDVEWFAEPREGGRVLANRGANGIDGVVSTATGVALSGARTVALVGDLAFVHDTNGLLGAVDRDIELTVVVVDNRGGGIFSFLPQASVLADDTFEALFGTPHDVDLAMLAEAHGARAHRADTAAELAALVGKCATARGVDVVLVSTDRARNVAVHDEINRAVETAVRDARSR